MSSWTAFRAIVAKDMKTYYLKPPNISRLNSSGERSSRSKERLRRSKVMVTASIEVVPKRIDMATTPGNSDRMSRGVRERR